MVLSQKQSCRPRNKVEDPNLTTRNYSYVTFDKIVKNTLEKGRHLQQMSKEQYVNTQKE